MGIISGGQVIASHGPYTVAGAPVAGTNQVETLTIGGTPTGGTFKIADGAQVTAAITWTATDATLVAAIDAALEALPTIGTGGVTTAAGTVSSGIGTITMTFAGGTTQKRLRPVLTIANNSLTGTSPTLAIAITTPGVDATAVTALKGAKLVDTTNGIDYINTGSDGAPTWTKTGTQS
jgi:hypothetical protein